VAEASWGRADAAPAVDWRMSAALENVPRGAEDLAEVKSLEGAVRAWRALDPDHRAAAVLTPERSVRLDEGEQVARFAGEAVDDLARHLPAEPA
jgi:hypothetical protein